MEHAQERRQTINGVEYAYKYGGRGTITLIAPISSTIDLMQLPDVQVFHNKPVTDEQKEHLSGALQLIVEDMLNQIPKAH